MISPLQNSSQQLAGSLTLPVDQEHELITDPLGRVIRYPNSLCNALDHFINEEAHFDQPQDVLKKPAFIITTEGEPLNLYYYRLISETKGILIKVKKEGESLTAVEYYLNPDIAMLSEIMKTGRFIL